MHGLPTGKGQKLAHQPRAAPGTIQNLAQILSCCAILPSCQGGFRRRTYSGQQIVEIMRNAAGKPANRFQPRRFFQLRLAPPPRRNVQYAEQGALLTA